MQEKIRKEKKAIDAFIDRNDLVILNEYPKSGVFKEKEYFRTSDGLYINVVDSGNGVRVVPNVDEVLVRFESVIHIKEYIKDSSTGVYYPNYSIFPKEFIYGNTASYATDPDYLTCNGWAVPLGFVGEKAIVNLIVPSSMAGQNDSYNFNPLFYKNLQYTHFH